MTTLIAFSDKERAYHLYQARQNFLRQQRSMKRHLLEARAAKEEALQAREGAVLARDAERQAKEVERKDKELEIRAAHGPGPRPIDGCGAELGGGILHGPEIAFDALGINDRNLDMIAPTKTRTHEERFILREGSAHRIVRLQPLLLPIEVQGLDNLAVQFTLKMVRAPDVRR